MKAITVKYLAPTYARGSRMKADDGDGNTLTIGYPHEFSGEKAYAQAAIALCRKMNWTGELIAGATKAGYVFCFTTSDRYTI